MAIVREIMTPEQVADHLQLSKDTVYRYIREGKLAASRLGRSYRIPRESVDLLLLATSTSRAAQEALFDRWEAVADRNRGVPSQEVESDIAGAIAEVRREKRP
ncbi:MAG: helix-turn-helix domain-containing protein [Dehalococcoidia bacterium]